MQKIILAAAALLIAAANPALACGGGHAYRAPQHVRAATATVAKTAKPATPAVAPEAREPTGAELASPSSELPNDGSRA